MLTDDELAAIEARAQAATPGPWTCDEGQYVATWTTDVADTSREDVAFIAHASPSCTPQSRAPWQI